MPSLSKLKALVGRLLKLREKVKVKILNDGNVVTFRWGTNLLKGLQAAGYNLLATCGGKGACATCRVKPREGFSDPKPEQLGPLAPKLRQEGWVLACQIPVMNDMTVELFKPLVQSWPKVEVKVEEKVEVEEAPTVKLKLSEPAQRIRKVLPGFNCAACGHPTCEEYAEAVALGRVSSELCLPGGKPVLEKVKRAAEAAR